MNPTNNSELLCHRINHVLSYTLAGTPLADENLIIEKDSGVVFEFHNAPVINLVLKEGRIWLHTPLQWLDESQVSSGAALLLEELQHPLPWVVTRQPVLGRTDKQFELKALIDEQCFASDSRFGELLDAFYALSRRLKQRLLPLFD
ncbi:type III secretion apparatus InvB [Pantoea sp. App145]|uniref:type III secretion apparatus InvB n=1 Tax=Pantoea sp. App145 TaxID=3071567 RepID=UPI003A806CAB